MNSTVTAPPAPTVTVAMDSKAVGGINALLALGVVNEPESRVETCMLGFAPNRRLGSDICTPYAVATRFTNP